MTGRQSHRCVVKERMVFRDIYVPDENFVLSSRDFFSPGVVPASPLSSLQ